MGPIAVMLLLGVPTLEAAPPPTSPTSEPGLAAPAAPAEDRRVDPAVDPGWPRFRGPGGTGHVVGPLPTHWSEDENVVWRTPIPGLGWSSPVVLEGRVWVTTALEEERSLRAVALDAATGAVVHDVEIFRPEAWQIGHFSNSQASPTPVLAPGRVWVHFGTYGTAALDSESGEVLWRNQEVRAEYEVGAGSSPIVWDDLVIVHFDGTDLQEVVAFDQESGAIVWRAPRELPAEVKPPHRKSFSTPIVVDAGRRLELISPGAQQVVAYDPRVGRRWWSVRYDGYSIVPSPVAGHGLVFVATGYMQAQLLAIRPGGIGDVTESRVAWSNRWQIPRNSSPLLVGDRIFLVSDHGRASWLDALTGEDLWMERLGGNHSASPIFADGRIYAFAEDGRTIVLEASDTFRVIGENRVEGQVLATPAGWDGSLFLRTATELLRIGGASPPDRPPNPEAPP